MPTPLHTQVEIETLHELLNELDYYSVLQLDRDCSQEAIGTAFRQESRRLHPDRMATVGGPETAKQANDVYRLINEAYRYLKDPEQRARYDQLLEGGVRRMTDDASSQAMADKRSGDPEHAATHPKGEKYWKLALRDWKDENYSACVMNIQFALNFEPDNKTFKEWLGKAQEAKSEQDKKKEKNPYKLRL